LYSICVFALISLGQHLFDKVKRKICSVSISLF